MSYSCNILFLSDDRLQQVSYTLVKDLLNELLPGDINLMRRTVIGSVALEGDIHKYSANAIERVKISSGEELPLKIEIEMKSEVGFFQVEEVLLIKIQSSPSKEPH